MLRDVPYTLPLPLFRHVLPMMPSAAAARSFTPAGRRAVSRRRCRRRRRFQRLRARFARRCRRSTRVAACDSSARVPPAHRVLRRAMRAPADPRRCRDEVLFSQPPLPDYAPIMLSMLMLPLFYAPRTPARTPLPPAFLLYGSYVRFSPAAAC